MKKIKKNIFGIGLAFVVILGISFSFAPQKVIAEGGYSCTISKDCVTFACGSVTISCTGTELCESFSTYIKCDGHITKCCSEPDND